MPNFNYTARDRLGNVTSGVLQATDRGELRRTLRESDLYLTGYKAVGTPQALSGSNLGASLFAPKPVLQDMVVAARQLGVTVRTGMPIIEALGIVGSQSSKPALREAFADLQQGVSDGQAISVGMRRHPKIFSRLLVALVEAGELSGTLDQALEVAAEQLDREDTLRRRVKAAMLYPKIVVVACVATVAAMLLVVVPIFSKVYSGLHATLPAPTLLLLAISALVIRAWWAVAAAGLALGFLAKRYAQTESGRRKIDRFALKVPIMGPLLRLVAIARFVQTLAGALRAGVPVLSALSISASTTGNIVIRDAVESVAEGVRDGAGISAELEKTGEFPLLATRMISAGESTGTIESMLEEINRFYERDIEDAVGKLTRSIEPLMTMLMGGIVLLVLLALYMPIFSLGNAFMGKK